MKLGGREAKNTQVLKKKTTSLGTENNNNNSNMNMNINNKNKNKNQKSMRN